MAKRLSLRNQLEAALKLYQKATGDKITRISHAVFANGSRLSAFMKNPERDVTTTGWEAAMQWLSDNWPEGVDWPAGVIRLEPKKRPGRRSTKAAA